MNPIALDHLFQEELYRFTTPVIVVLARPWESYTPEEQLLLQKILTSVKVDINSVKIVIGASIELGSLNVYQPSKVLIFGAEAGEPTEKYQEVAAQGFTVIRADDLSAMDDHKKKNLWVALRHMFGV